MMTIVTRVTLRQGSEPEWDDAMRQRLAAAKDQPGWIGGQLLMPLDRLDQRVIVGVWQSRADWEAWHAEETFRATRARLEGLEAAPGEHAWHEVLLDLRT